MIAALVLVGLVLVLSAVVAALDRRPAHVGLALLAITAPLEVYRTPVAGVNVSLFRLSVGLALILALWCARGRLLAAIRQWLGGFVVLGLLAFAAAVLLSVAVNPTNTFLGLRLAANTVIGLLAVITVAALVREVGVERAVTLVIAGSVLPILASAWQLFAARAGRSPDLPLLDVLPAAAGLEVSRDGGSSLGEIAERAKGTFADPNHLGAYLMVVLLLAVGLTAVRIVSRADAPRVVTPAAIVIAAMASLLATYSRSAWLGALIGLLAAIPLVVRPVVRAAARPRRIALGAAGAVALLAAIALPLLPALGARLSSGMAANVTSNTSHLETAEAAIDAFLSAPVTGIGAGGLGVLLDQGRRTSGAHSSYLTIAAELGTVGSLAAVAIVVAALRALQLRRRTSASPATRVLIGAAIAAYAGLLVANVTYDLWWDDFHWLVLGMIAGAAVLTSTSEAAPEGAPSSAESAPAHAVVGTAPR